MDLTDILHHLLLFNLLDLRHYCQFRTVHSEPSDRCFVGSIGGHRLAQSISVKGSFALLLRSHVCLRSFQYFDPGKYALFGAASQLGTGLERDRREIISDSVRLQEVSCE